MTTYAVTNACIDYTNNEGEEDAVLRLALEMEYGEAIELGNDFVVCTDKDYKNLYKERGRATVSLLIASNTNKVFKRNRDYWTVAKDKIGACNFNRNIVTLEYAVIVSENEYEKLRNDLKSYNPPSTVTLICEHLDEMFRVDRNKGLKLNENGDTLMDAVNEFRYRTLCHTKQYITKLKAIELYNLMKWKLIAIIVLLVLILLNT